MEAEICALAPSDWQIRSVEDVCKRVTSGGTPSRTRPDFYVDGSWPWVKTQELQDTWIDHTEEKITDKAVADSSAKVLPPNTILLAMYGATVGKLGILRSPMTCNQACCAMIVDSAKADFRYLYHHLRYSRTQLKSLATGAAQQNLSGALIKSLLYPFPPLPVQRAIAHILGTLDDKIELNRRMNATLEAMARALFQSWFVDFDPVRAKLDGRPPAALDPATAALFPRSFDETALGHIPHGWEVKTLGEVIDLAYGKPLKAEDRKDGPVCVYGANGPVGWHDEKLVSGPGIIVGRKGNPGVVTWAHGDFYPIDTTFYVEPKGECRSLYFLYYALSLHTLANLSADSAVPGLNRNHAYMSKQVIPSPPVLKAFDSQISAIFAAIHANEEQSRTLATLRDTLLPKLLSGELSVAPTDKESLSVQNTSKKS